MEYEIKSSDSPYNINMAPWCNEKAEFSLVSIVRAIDKIRETKELEEETKESILSELSTAVFNISKLLSFSCGAHWDTSDPDIIFIEGYTGLEKVMVKYGMLEETTEDRKPKEIKRSLPDFQALLVNLQTLLEGPRNPNRTLLHEFLVKIEFKHPLLDEIKESLEQVTMGEIEWSSFVEKTEESIKHLRKIFL